MLGFHEVTSQQSPSFSAGNAVPRTSQPPVVVQAGVLVANG